MALSLVCGAECQIVNTGSGAAADSHWSARTDGNASTPAVESTVVRSGSHSFKFQSDSSGNSSLKHNASGTSPSVDYFRGYFYLPDVTPAADTTIVLGSTSSW
jgi:hypothetical protein